MHMAGCIGPPGLRDLRALLHPLHSGPMCKSTASGRSRRLLALGDSTLQLNGQALYFCLLDLGVGGDVRLVVMQAHTAMGFRASQRTGIR